MLNLKILRLWPNQVEELEEVGTREKEMVQAPAKQRKDMLRRCVKISSVWNRVTGIIKMKPYMCMTLTETS